MQSLALRRFFVLMVGMDVKVPPKIDTEFQAEGPEGRIIFASRAYRTFDEALAHLQLRPDTQLVHVGNQAKASHTELIKGCRLLAHAMAVHGAKPGVDFAYRNLQYLARPFVRAGVKVHETWDGVDDEKRWTSIARERMYAR